MLFRSLEGATTSQDDEPLDQLADTTDQNTNTTYAYDYESPLLTKELDGQGNVVSEFTYTTQNPVPDYLIREGVWYRIITDLMGNPRLVINATTGVVAQAMAYDQFGQVVQDTNPGFQPFGFAGTVRP